MKKDHTAPEKLKLLRLFAGALVFAAGIALEKVLHTGGSAPFVVFIAAYLVLGGDVIVRALKNITRGRVFDENFLMGIATAGAFAIGQATEAAAVMLFYQIGECFQEAAVRKSKKSITALMDIRPDYANLKKDGGAVRVSPDTVNIGDIIFVKPGEKIPLDGVVVEGQSMIDTSALTGESVPRKADVSEEVLSGCINLSGVLTIEVTRTFTDSAVTKIIALVESAAGRKARPEQFITAFARYYTPAVVLLAAALAFLPPVFLHGEWREWINRGLIFLVISCPCALVLSVPMSYFAGLGRAAKHGILIKGGNFLEACTRLETVVFDKTGTLTKGVFKVTQVHSANGFSDEALLGLAAHAEAFSNHPIAVSVMREYPHIDRNALSQYRELPGLGVGVNLDGKVVLAGNNKLMERAGIPFEAAQNPGTKVYVAANGVFAGSIVISDELKPDSRDAVSALKARGVRKTVMLTGDNPQIAGQVGSALAIDEVYAGLLPHEKVEKLGEIAARKSAKGCLAFVGDGINDAPVLAMADIGVAMGGLGSDAAIEAADVVLMRDEPSKLAGAIDIARFTGRIVRQNIIFALGVKVVFLLLGAFGAASMWEAVFADVGVCVLAVLNSMRIAGFKPLPAKTGAGGGQVVHLRRL